MEKQASNGFIAKIVAGVLLTFLAGFTAWSGTKLVENGEGLARLEEKVDAMRTIVSGLVDAQHEGN